MPNPLIPDDWEFAPNEQQPQRWFMFLAYNPHYFLAAEIVHCPEGVDYSGNNTSRVHGCGEDFKPTYILRFSGKYCPGGGPITESGFVYGCDSIEKCRVMAKVAMQSALFINDLLGIEDINEGPGVVEME